MRIWSVLLTFLIVFTSCTPKEEVSKVVIEQPVDLIPQDKMIQVLADVHLLEGALQFRSPHVPSRSPYMGGVNELPPAPLPTDQKSMPYYDIFAKYGFTQDQYQRSLKWYSMDAELYGQMYDEVINELVRRQAQEQNGVSVTPPPNPAK